MTGLGEALAYRPSDDRWLAVSDPPMSVELSEAVWTGSALFAWGGMSGPTYPTQGLMYQPTATE